jgi:mannose-1-phosphate guanylyltransferase
MYAVILAGGGGTRLWPLSSPKRPKPFLPFFSDGTLFQKTVDRLSGSELDIPLRDITVIAATSQAALAQHQRPGIQILIEPEGRNTAAAIALATLAIDRDPDEVMLVLPADHLIEAEAQFRAVLADAEAVVTSRAFGVDSPLVTLGVQTSRAATEYGYLIPRAGAGATVRALHVDHLSRFEEKPTAERAEVLRREPGVAWNAGMFLWRRRAIRAALESHAPDVIHGIARGLKADDLAGAYASIPSISIDYAVMEPAAAAGQVVMASLNVGWSDLGSWTALLEALGLPGVAAHVVKPGESVEVEPDDLVVERIDGRLVARADAHGTMRPSEPIAVLRRARAQRRLVDELLERCSRPEA